MVIGFDGSRAFVPGRTGTENYSYQLLKALAKIDQNNTYTIYIRPHSVILSSSPSREWPRNFQFKEINWPRLWTQGGLAVQTFKDSLDVLFVPAHTIPVIRRPGLKTVITVHDLGSEYLSAMHQVKQRIYLSFMQKLQLKTATKIIAVSKATKEDLVKKIGIDSKKIKVVYEGYDKKLFRPIKGDLLVNSLKQFGLKQREYFLFVGTVQPRKNLERLIKAFALYSRSLAGARQSNSPSSLRLESARSASRTSKLVHFGTSRLAQTETDLRSSSAPLLVLAGSKGWLADDIYQLPKKLGIEDKVKFLGYVPEKDLPILYSGAIALAFPSLFEGFGLPILEAQACGCPVLTSNISSMPEVAGLPAGGGAISVNPYSVDDIVEGMKKIINLDTRNKLIQAGFENIKRFSWEKCAKETLGVLEETNE